MSWYILVVLQTASIYSSNSASNWQPIGEFRGEAACIAASKRLVDAQQKSSAAYKPSTFVCLPKEGR